MSKRKSKHLLILENGTQFNGYINLRKSLQEHELLICCMTIDAIQFCKINNLKYIIPDDFYTQDELELNRTDSENIIKKLVKKLNEFYSVKFQKQYSFDFEMGNYHYFMLYHFLGALHFRAFIFKNIIEKLEIDNILIPKEKKAKNIRPFPVSQYINCNLDLCLNSKYKNKVIIVPILNSVNREYKTLYTTIRRIISTNLRKLNFVNNYLNVKQNNIIRSLYNIIFNINNAEILLLGIAGPWKYILGKEYFHNKVNIIYDIEEIEIPENEVHDWFFEWFNWKDDFLEFNISALFKFEMGRVKILSEQILAMHYKTLESLKKTKCILFTVATYSKQQYILSLAKSIGIPRICFQHGEMSLYYPGLWNDASELIYASHYFSYGNEVSIEKISSASKLANNISTINIGAPSLDKIMNITSIKTNLSVLYASSKFINYSGGFISSYVDISVMNNQNKLIEFFEEHLSKYTQDKVIWKLNQERRTSQPVAKANLVQVIREEKTFLELIKDANLIILDRPSTTSLEVCMTELPLFVLLANKNWYDLPEKLLRKRAVVCYTPDELLVSVKKFMQEGFYPADLKNREFVRSYGSYLDDGKSSERATIELLNIINKS
jgi:hypothetical protein